MRIESETLGEYRTRVPGSISGTLPSRSLGPRRWSGRGREPIRGIRLQPPPTTTLPRSVDDNTPQRGHDDYWPRASRRYPVDTRMRDDDPFFPPPHRSNIPYANFFFPGTHRGAILRTMTYRSVSQPAPCDRGATIPGEGQPPITTPLNVNKGLKRPLMSVIRGSEKERFCITLC